MYKKLRLAPSLRNIRESFGGEKSFVTLGATKHNLIITRFCNREQMSGTIVKCFCNDSTIKAFCSIKRVTSFTRRAVP